MTATASSNNAGLAPIFGRRASGKRARAEATEDSLEGLPGDKLARLAEPSVPSTSTVAGPIEKYRFSWLNTNPASLLHGVWGPPVYSSKLACFDVDGTLIETKSGAKFPRDGNDWKFWCAKGTVQARLREYHQAGYSIVFVSNQKYAPHSKPHQAFKTKMPLIGKALTDIPFRVLAATAGDINRKPSIGMYTVLEQLWRSHNVVIDKASSFYVGDAAGRPAGYPGRKNKLARDHADTDKGWALNVGIEFYTPEDFFWEKKDLLRGASLTTPTSDMTSNASSNTLDAQAPTFVPGKGKTPAR